MSSLLVFNKVYRLEKQSVILVYSTPLVNCCPSTFSLTSPPKVNIQYIQTVCGGVLSCVVDHILSSLTLCF